MAGKDIWSFRPIFKKCSNGCLFPYRFLLSLVLLHHPPPFSITLSEIQNDVLALIYCVIYVFFHSSIIFLFAYSVLFLRIKEKQVAMQVMGMYPPMIQELEFYIQFFEEISCVFCSFRLEYKQFMSNHVV